MDHVISLFVLALAVSAVSMTISKAKIFYSFREWLSDRNGWLGELVSCPYCTSHWVALAAVLIFQPIFTTSNFYIADLLISMFAIVALAAMSSGLIYRAFAGMESE